MVNKVILIGNVGADPEIRTLENGTKVARVRLATTEKLYNRTTKESQDHTEWHTITLWRGLADVADRFVRKGSQIYIEGSLRSNEWTDASGVKRYGVEVLAREMKLLGRRSDSQSGGGSGGGGSSAQDNQPQSASSFGSSGAYSGGSSAKASEPSSAPETATSAEEIDDLPF